MNKTLPKFVSIHIPKCGGITFREILLAIYKHDCLLDNGLCPIPPKFGESIYPNNWENYNVIHGHFDYAKYNHLPLITWVRDPLDRLISLYHYWQGRNQNDIFPKFMKNNSLSIYQFAEFLPNVQTMFIGEKVERFMFIGLVEFYEKSLKRFGDIMCLKIPEYEKKNINPESKKQYDDVDKDWLELYLKKDRIVYNEILAKWGF